MPKYRLTARGLYLGVGAFATEALLPFATYSPQPAKPLTLPMIIPDRFLIVVQVTVLLVTALYFGQPVLMPLATAVLLTFLLRPAVVSLERRRLPRAAAVILVLCSILAMLGSVGWVVSRQFHDLALHLDDYRGHLRTKIESIRGSDSSAVKNVREVIDEVSEALESESRTLESRAKASGADTLSVKEQAAAAAVAATADTQEPATPQLVKVVPEPVSPTGTLRLVWESLATPLTTTFLVVVLVIFMLMDFEDLRNRVLRLAGQTKLTLTTKTLDDVSKRISRYLLMNATVNGGFGLAIFVGLYTIGVAYSALWGFLAAVLRFVPYVGPMASAALSISMAMIQFPDWTHPALVLALYVVVELFTNNFVEPLTYGKSAGVSTVALLVSATFWTWLWGPMGLVLSVPLTVVFAVIGSNIPQFEALAILLGDSPVLEPSAVFYQRLLAGDTVEADNLLAVQLAGHDRREVYDHLLLPALVLAERDRNQGALTDDDKHQVWQAAEDLIDAHAPLEEEPTPKRIRIVACPAQDEADEIALQMLKHVAPPHCEFVVLPWELMASEKIASLEQQPADAVLISALGPGGSSHIRYLCKRFRQEHERLRIIVGRWGFRGDRETMTAALKARGADQLVTSFQQAQEAIERISPVSVNV